jgi:hypothetical protein
VGQCEGADDGPGDSGLDPDAVRQRQYATQLVRSPLALLPAIPETQDSLLLGVGEERGEEKWEREEKGTKAHGTGSIRIAEYQNMGVSEYRGTEFGLDTPLFRYSVTPILSLLPLQSSLVLLRGLP